MNRALFVSLMLLICAGGVHAQLYKSVGPDGKVTYSDTPPSTASKVEIKTLAGNGAIDVNNLPAEVANAVKSNPVVIYTTATCPACDEGRKLLNERGIPFSEKTVSSDTNEIDALKRAGGGKSLPFLLVGRNKQEGFEAGAWNSLLTTAAYPESNKLPKTYRNPQAQSAAPAQKAASADTTSQTQTGSTNSGSLPEPIGNAPPGFRF